jgi:hypothetical protein
MEAMRTMLRSGVPLPLSLWAEAANTAVHVWNKTVNTQLVNLTKMFFHLNLMFPISKFLAVLPISMFLRLLGINQQPKARRYFL